MAALACDNDPIRAIRNERADTEACSGTDDADIALGVHAGRTDRKEVRWRDVRNGPGSGRKVIHDGKRRQIEASLQFLDREGPRLVGHGNLVPEHRPCDRKRACEIRTFRFSQRLQIVGQRVVERWIAVHLDMLQPAIGPILRDRKSRIGAANTTDQSQSAHSQLHEINSDEVHPRLACIRADLSHHRQEQKARQVSPIVTYYHYNVLHWAVAMLVLGARLTDGLTTSCLKALRAWPVDLPCRLAL